MAGEDAREQATTRALDALPSGAWRELYQVRGASRLLANLDHIVVGRAGIFIVDSRDWAGDLEVGPQSLTHDGISPEATLSHLVDAAKATAELLPDLDPRHVVPVLCFDNKLPLSAWVGGVLVCTTANVVDVLLAQPRVVGAEQVDTLFNRLMWALPLVSYRVGEPKGEARSGHRREGKARTRLGRRKRSSARHAR